MNYYDLVLSSIPVVVVGGTLSLLAAGLAVTVAVSIAVAGALLVVGHGLFVNTPAGRAVPSTSEPETAPDASATDGPVAAD
ncbi:hypothetical protein BRD17_10050 [Halobacteriales archaeon SW_7_68_16]|nr:MAG: hypothetical protein BRD17_10050 [Halobacteriales archaeon SW_7_68_16]